MTDILNEIQNKLPELSKGQKKIARYILDEYNKAAFMTAGVLGKSVQVSESTVVRFAGEMGYDGYPELQKALQEMVLHRLTSVQRMEIAEKQFPDHDVLTHVFQGDMDRIHRTQEGLDRKAFDGAVEALLGAKKVYILGVRSSSALASFLYYYLRYIVEDVRLITSASSTETLEHLMRLSPGDTVFSISFPRYSTAVLQATEYARHMGARCIVLTDAETSPLAKYADFLLTAKCDMISLVNSLAAPMSVINAVIASAASRRSRETTELFDKLEEVWDYYHVYEKADE